MLSLFSCFFFFIFQLYSPLIPFFFSPLCDINSISYTILIISPSYLRSLCCYTVVFLTISSFQLPLFSLLSTFAVLYISLFYPYQLKPSVFFFLLPTFLSAFLCHQEWQQPADFPTMVLLHYFFFLFLLANPVYFFFFPYHFLLFFFFSRNG